MAQHDNRIRAEFFGAACCKCHNASMPYRSGGGVEIADYVIRPRWIAEISWNYVRGIYERSGEVGQFCCWPE
jgi:hypothetical protein